MCSLSHMISRFCLSTMFWWIFVVFLTGIFLCLLVSVMTHLFCYSDSDNEIGEIHDLDAGEQSLTGSEGVKLLGQGQRRRRGKEPAERESSRLKR